MPRKRNFRGRDVPHPKRRADLAKRVKGASGTWPAEAQRPPRPPIFLMLYEDLADDMEPSAVFGQFPRAEAARVVRPSGMIGFVHYIVPRPPPNCIFEKAFGLSTGFGFPMRAITLMRREQPRLEGFD